MLSSALIGCLKVRLNVELWENIYLSQVVISLGNYAVNKMQASESRY